MLIIVWNPLGLLRLDSFRGFLLLTAFKIGLWVFKSKMSISSTSNIKLRGNYNTRRQKTHLQTVTAQNIEMCTCCYWFVWYFYSNFSSLLAVKFTKNLCIRIAIGACLNSSWLAYFQRLSIRWFCENSLTIRRKGFFILINNVTENL